jgi:CRISPR-associated endoribonuclease Cas6
LDLLSLVLTLKLLEAGDDDIPAPRWWGRAAQAVLLETVQKVDPVLAGALHDPQAGAETPGGQVYRPYTVSNLVGRFSRQGPRTDERYGLRLSAMQGKLAEVLLAAAAPSGQLSAGERLKLAGHTFEITTTSWGESTPGGEIDGPLSAWAGATGYRQISSALLLSKEQAPRRITLDFASPTTFKSGGMHLPVPLPGLVFGSLLEKWNAFAPLAFPVEARRYAEECLALGRYHLRSRAVQMKGRGVRIGGVGRATYVSVNYDRYWMSVIGVLAAFAAYSGVGAGTTMGLGQTRWIEGS